MLTNAVRTGYFARLGQRSPLIVTGVYAAGFTLYAIVRAIALHYSTDRIRPLGALFWFAGFLAAYTIVTWYRDDDVVAAGFLLGVSVGAVNFLVPVLVLLVGGGSVGGAALGFMAGIIPGVIITAVAIAIAMLFIWIGRLIQPGIATPIPPPRKL